MEWLQHPRYQHVREEVVAKFKGKRHTFHKLQHVTFLCGAAKSPRRDRLALYLRKRHDDCLVFYAEDAWKHVASAATSTGSSNALDLESEFAKWADIVIIIVESPGTFTELGAFSLSDPLRKKLLPILDDQWKAEESFINTGPVRWVNRESLFSPSIFVNLNRILDAAGDIDERIIRLEKPRRSRLEDLTTSPKHFLFFLVDLIATIGPATTRQLKFYVDAILGGSGELNLEYVLGLAIALKLIISRNGEDGTRYYYPSIDAGLEPSLRKKFFDLPIERARVLSVLQNIDAAQAALHLILS